MICSCIKNTLFPSTPAPQHLDEQLAPLEFVLRRLFVHHVRGRKKAPHAGEARRARCAVQRRRLPGAAAPQRRSNAYITPSVRAECLYQRLLTVLCLHAAAAAARKSFAPLKLFAKPPPPKRPSRQHQRLPLASCGGYRVIQVRIKHLLWSRRPLSVALAARR